MLTLRYPTGASSGSTISPDSLTKASGERKAPESNLSSGSPIDRRAAQSFKKPTTIQDSSLPLPSSSISPGRLRHELRGLRSQKNMPMPRIPSSQGSFTSLDSSRGVFNRFGSPHSTEMFGSPSNHRPGKEPVEEIIAESEVLPAAENSETPSAVHSVQPLAAESSNTAINTRAAAEPENSGDYKYAAGRDASLGKIFWHLELASARIDEGEVSDKPGLFKPRYKTVAEYVGEKEARSIRPLIDAAAKRFQEEVDAKAAARAKLTFTPQTVSQAEAEKVAMQLRKTLELAIKPPNPRISNSTATTAAADSQPISLNRNGIVVVPNPENPQCPVFVAPASGLEARLNKNEKGTTLNFAFLSKEKTNTPRFLRLKKNMKLSIRRRRTGLSRALKKSNLQRTSARKTLFSQIRQIAHSCRAVFSPENSLRINDVSGKAYLRNYLRELAQIDPDKFEHVGYGAKPEATPSQRP